MKQINKFTIFILILGAIGLFFNFLPAKIGQVNEDKTFIQNPHDIVEKSGLNIAVKKVKKPLNPLNDGGDMVSLLSRLTNSSLFTRDENNEFVPEIVDEYWYDNEGLTISLILKKGYKFGDGKEIKAHHIKNTYQALADPTYRGTYLRYVDNLEDYYPYKLGQKQQLDSIEIVEDHFMKFHFRNRDFTNISTLTFPILDIENHEISYRNIGDLLEKDFINGAGRYKFVESDYNKTKLNLKEEDRNKDISLDEVNIYSMNSNDAIKEFKRGSIDIVYKYQRNEYFNDQVDDRLRDYSYTIDHQDNNYHFLGFSTESSFFKDKKYRKALRNSFDIEEIVVDSFGQGLFSFPETAVYNNSWFNIGRQEFQEGPDLLQTIEEDGGFDGELKLKIIASEDDTFFKRIEETFIEKLNNKFLDFEVEYLTSQEMFQALRGERDFDIFISQRHLTEIPNITLEEKYPIEDEYALFNLAEDSFYYALDLLKAEKDQEENKLVTEWQRNFEDISPYIVLATENKTTVINSKIRGIYLNEFIGLDYLENLTNIVLIQ